MYLIIFIAGLVLDRLTKYLIAANVELHQKIEVIPWLLNITHERNTGAAFSIMQGRISFFIVFTVFAFIMIFFLWRTTTKEQRLLRVSLTMLATGAIGNFIDRIMYGYVVDFFEIPFNFPVFNVADIMIVVSVVLILFTIFTDKKVRL